MLGWSIGFLIAALVAAYLGFGGVATAFAEVAVIFFYIFGALFILSLIVGLFGRGSGARFSRAGRSFIMFAGAAAIGALVYAWADNDWNAEQLGRELDQNAAELSEDVGRHAEQAMDTTGDLIDEASTNVRNTTAEVIDDDDGADHDQEAS